MSRSMREEGEKLIREGERILQRDVQHALNECDFRLMAATCGHPFPRISLPPLRGKDRMGG